MVRRFPSTVILVLLAAVGCSRLDAPGGTVPAGLHVVEGLGTLAFPNSGNAAAQEPFLRGVLLLHSFEYDAAAEAFREAQQADPNFALAYWGEAMTYNHPLWQ
ncbi:MAG TPA: tetratricopeptide repeat protein, partial [Vicinamibacterales bacterium]|nr:tetratricopeptide repeat protein [Vicinamibacterales bacterium]